MPNKIVVTSLLFLIIMLNTSYALTTSEGIDIIITPERVDSYPTGIIEYNITIKSILNNGRTLMMEITGDKLAWITVDTTKIKIGAKGEEGLIFLISPEYGAKAGWYEFQVKFTSEEDPSYLYTKDLHIYVKERAAVEITTFKAIKDEFFPEEEIEILLGLNNTGYVDTVNVIANIKLTGKKETKEISVDVPRMTGNEEKTLTETISLDKYLAVGEYVMTVFLIDEGKIIDTAVNKFNIKSAAIIKKDRKTLSNLILQKEIEVTIRNEGNEEKSVDVKEDLLSIPYMYSFDTPPTLKKVNGYESYVWTCKLAPSEQCTVKYTIKFWVPILMIIIITIIFYLIYEEMQKPKIRKRSIKRGKLHSVHLYIKNRSRGELKEVQVREFIPKIFKVVKDFRGVKPKINKKINGIELIWKIGRLHAHEERVLTYKIMPSLDVVGGLTLPPARITGITEKGKIYKRKSSHIKIS